MSASSSLTRRANSTSNKPANSDSTSANSHSHTHSHSSGTNGHSHDEHDDHSHSHSVFGLHAHSHEGGSANADQIVNALQSTGDRGSRVTLIGLFSNVVLTGAKGAAGVYMHSASLMADAAHSMSDLLGDFVTLFCWRLSRKPPTERYPYGFAKFETLGTTTVSLLLVGGALGIGFHSFHLLGHALAETASTMPAGPMQTVLQNVTALTSHIPAVGHSHGHAHALDPNAAWFAAVSVVAKEWLYRITKKVADDEHSPVLLANAVHHRSDAYSSLVALVAILGSWFFPHIPLDPIGGLLVSFVIFQQGLSILRGAYNDLTEASVSPTTRQSLIKALDPLITGVSASSSSSPAELSIGKPSVLSISHLRARWVGSLIFVDLTADVESVLTVKDTAELEERIVEMLRGGRREVMDVRVRFRPVV